MEADCQEAHHASSCSPKGASSKNIQTNFTVQLNARNYLGRLDFNHKQNTLTIVVNPDSKANAAALDIERDIRSLGFVFAIFYLFSGRCPAARRATPASPSSSPSGTP